MGQPVDCAHKAKGPAKHALYVALSELHLDEFILRSVCRASQSPGQYLNNRIHLITI